MKAFPLLLTLLIVCAQSDQVMSGPVQLKGGFGDFFVGIFKGFQSDPSRESLCVIELRGVVQNIDLLFEYISMIFSNYNNIFRSLNQFADFMDTLDLSVKSCEFSRLVEQINALTNFSGRSVLVARMAIKSQFIIEAWRTFYYSLLNGAGEAMGVAVGNIFSVLLNFSI